MTLPKSSHLKKVLLGNFEDQLLLFRLLRDLGFLVALPCCRKTSAVLEALDSEGGNPVCPTTQTELAALHILRCCSSFTD